MNMENNLQIKFKETPHTHYTQMPNIIFDTLPSQLVALYGHIRKIAGEQGEAHPSMTVLAKKLSISKQSLRKYLSILISKKLIIDAGFVEVMTSGGPQYARSFMVEDIWALNGEYYQKNGQKYDQNTLFEGGSNGNRGVKREPTLEAKGGKNKNLPGGKTRPPYKNHIVKNHSNTAERSSATHSTLFQEAEKVSTSSKDVPSTNVSKLIDAFSSVNPSFSRFFSNKTQRASAERLITQHSLDKLLELMKILPEIVTLPFAPSITSPYELETKFGKLLIFIEQNKKLSTNKNNVAFT
jgi:hypothetical protein